MDIMSQSVNQELIEFLDNSPTCFQAVENFRKMLKDAGYSELLECEKWEIVPGEKYFVTRMIPPSSLFLCRRRISTVSS